MIEYVLSERELADAGPDLQRALDRLKPGRMLTSLEDDGRTIRFAIIHGEDLEYFFDQEELRRIQRVDAETKRELAAAKARREEAEVLA